MYTSRSRLRLLAFTMTFLLALASLSGAAAASIDPDDDPGSPVRRSQASVAHQLFDAVFNEGDIDAAEALIADDAEIRTSFGDYRGPEGLLDYVAFVKRTYPDAVFDVTGVAVRGDAVVVNWIMTASKVVIDPVEQPVLMTVEITGASTLTIGESQVADLTLTNESVAITAPEAEAAVIQNGGNSAQAATTPADDDVATGYPCPLFCDA